MKEYKYHELADLFPMMEGEEFEELKEDIKENGLLEPIVLYEGKILDGRNRYKACKELGRGVTFKKFPSNWDPMDYVIAENLHRRHLTSAARAEIGLEILEIEEKKAKERQGTRTDLNKKNNNTNTNIVPSEGTKLNQDQDQKNKPKEKKESKRSVEKAAKKTKISKNTLYTAKKVKELNDPKINEKWEDAKKGKAYIKDVDKAIKEKERKEITEKKKEENLKKERQKQLEIQKETKEEYIATIYKKDVLDFLETIKDRSQDLLITDPPYMTDLEDLEGFVKKWVSKAISKVKSTGKIYIFTGPYPKELQAYITELLQQERFELSNILVWTYRNTLGPSTKRKYKNNWQACFYLYGKEAPPLNTDRLKEKFSVMDFNAPDGRQYNRYHKWQKPSDLSEMLITHSTKENDKVFDPFAGTGTFILKATEMKRYAKGCDIDPEILKIAKKRGCIIK